MHSILTRKPNFLLKNDQRTQRGRCKCFSCEGKFFYPTVAALAGRVGDDVVSAADPTQLFTFETGLGVCSGEQDPASRGAQCSPGLGYGVVPCGWVLASGSQNPRVPWETSKTSPAHIAL